MSDFAAYLNKILDDAKAPAGELVATRLRLLIAQLHELRITLDDARRDAAAERARRIDLERWLEERQTDVSKDLPIPLEAMSWVYRDYHVDKLVDDYYAVSYRPADASEQDWRCPTLEEVVKTIQQDERSRLRPVALVPPPLGSTWRKPGGEP